MKKVKFNVPMILGILVLLIALYFLFGNSSGISPGERLKTITCEVTAFNVIGIPFVQNGDTIIESKSCRSATASRTSCIFASVNPLSTIDNVKIQLDVGGKVSSQAVSIIEGFRKTVTLTAKCVKESVSQGTISITDDTGKVTDSEQVQV